MERVKRSKPVARIWKMHGLRDFDTALIDKNYGIGFIER